MLKFSTVRAKWSTIEWSVLIPKVLVISWVTAFTDNLYMLYLKLLGFPIVNPYDRGNAYTMKIYWTSFVAFFIFWFWLANQLAKRSKEKRDMKVEEQNDSIWRRYNKIMKDRADKLQEAMADYDQQVHRPALIALQQECAAEGHSRGNFHDNGLGWTWYYCSKCGAQMDKQGPADAS